MLLKNIAKPNLWRQSVTTSSNVFALCAIAALPVSTSFTDIFLVLAVATMLLSMKITELAHDILNNRIALLFLIFFGLFLLGATYSSAPTHDILKSLLKDSKLLYGALLIPIFREQKWRTHAFTVFIFTMTFVMTLSYANFFGLIHSQYHNAAVFKSHIQINFLMAFYAYLLLNRAFDNKQYHKTYLILFLFALTNTLFLSEGRSGYVVFAALMMLFGWQRYSWKGLLTMLAFITGLASTAYFSSSKFHGRINTVISQHQQYQQGDKNTSVGKRLVFYKHALQLIKEKPIIGSGTGSVVSRMKAIEKNPQLRTHNVHNEYLNIGIQLGLLGLGFLAYFFSMIAIKSFELPKNEQYLAQATLIAIASGCLLNSWLMDSVQGHFFSMMLGICFGAL